MSKKLRLALASAFLLLCGAALICLTPEGWASQNNLWNPTAGTLSGLSMVQNYNNAIDSVNTCNSGATAPSNQLSGVPSASNCWDDTSVSGWIRRKVYDGTQWIVTHWIDTTNHLYVGQVGGGSPPNVASAATTDLCSVNPAYLNLTGTTTITSFGSNCQTGQWKRIKFTGALTLTYNVSSFILPGAANITTAAGDTADVVYLGSGNWIVAGYHPASGLPIGPCATHTLLSNNGGSSVPTSCNTLTAILDAMLGSTQGSIIYRGASSWTLLGPGSAAQLLQSGGAGANPSWVTISAPVLLNTVTGSGVAALSDTTSITATYPAYRIIMQNLVCATAAQTMQIQIHANGAFQNASYVAAAAGSASQTSTSGVPMSAAETMSASGYSGEFEVTAPSQTSSPKQLFGKGSYSNSTNSARAIVFGGNWTGGNQAVDGIQTMCQSGNISGTLRMYGLP